MQKFRENLESRKDQNLMSLVLTVCFLMVFFSFWGAFSMNAKTAENPTNPETVAVVQVN